MRPCSTIAGGQESLTAAAARINVRLYVGKHRGMEAARVACPAAQIRGLGENKSFWALSVKWPEQHALRIAAVSVHHPVHGDVAGA